MIDHTTLRLTETERQALAALAEQLGYVRTINGHVIPDMSGLIKAICRGELKITKEETLNTYARINLTPEEMQLFCDGQDWYDNDADVWLGGYLPDADNPNPAFDLVVTGEVHDNWIHWAGMPQELRQRLSKNGEETR